MDEARSLGDSLGMDVSVDDALGFGGLTFPLDPLGNPPFAVSDEDGLSPVNPFSSFSGSEEGEGFSVSPDSCSGSSDSCSRSGDSLGWGELWSGVGDCLAKSRF